MSRNVGAALSPSELNALRRVDHGLANFLPPAHRDVLISMALVGVSGGGHLVVTEAGRQRLLSEAPPRLKAHTDRRMANLRASVRR